MSIEDELFNELSGLTKDMYDEAIISHNCSICDENLNATSFYARKIDDIEGAIIENIPYLFICNECYEELPEKSNEQNTEISQ